MLNSGEGGNLGDHCGKNWALSGRREHVRSMAHNSPSLLYAWKNSGPYVVGMWRRMFTPALFVIVNTSSSVASWINRLQSVLCQNTL